MLTGKRVVCHSEKRTQPLTKSMSACEMFSEMVTYRLNPNPDCSDCGQNQK